MGRRARNRAAARKAAETQGRSAEERATERAGGVPLPAHGYSDMFLVPGSVVARLVAERMGQADAAWRARHGALAAQEAALAAQQAAMESDHGHRLHGTVQTLAAARATQQGAVARLFMAGHVSLQQMGSAEEIVAAHARIIAGVKVACASLEARVDNGAAPFDRVSESMGAVRRELAYGHWREDLRRRGHHDPRWRGRGLLFVAMAVIVDDMPLSRAARDGAMRNTTARAAVGLALDLWPDAMDLARAEMRQG